MAQRIQRFPDGFTSLVQIYGGQTPALIEDNVRPVLEMLPFYVARQMEQVEATGPLTTAGTFLDLTVPSGEYWYVQAITGILASTAAQTPVFFCGYRVPQAGSTLQTARHDSQIAMAAGETRRCGGFLPYTLILAPGSIIRFQLERTLTAAQTTFIVASIARLTV